MFYISNNFFAYSCHLNCAENSPEIGVFEGKWTGVFDTVNRSRYSECNACQGIGATVLCSFPSCSHGYHFPCACKMGWNYEESGIKFLCPKHNMDLSSENAVLDSNVNEGVVESQSFYGATVKNDVSNIVAIDSSDEELDPHASLDDHCSKKDVIAYSIDVPLTSNFKGNNLNGSRSIVRLGRISRNSVRDRWNVEFYATCLKNSSDRILTVASTIPDPFDQFEEGDVVKSVNGMRIGSINFDTLQKFYMFINQQVEVLLEVRRIL